MFLVVSYFSLISLLVGRTAIVCLTIVKVEPLSCLSSNLFVFGKYQFIDLFSVLRNLKPHVIIKRKVIVLHLLAKRLVFIIVKLSQVRMLNCFLNCIS